MKRKLCTLLALVLAVLIFALPALADEEKGSFFSYDYEIMSAEDMSALYDYAESVSESYGCGVYMVVVKDFTDYGFGSIREFAEAYYMEYGLGYGEGQNGELLVLSMADRDYSLIAYGDYGNYAFTDYGKDVLSDSFLPYFANNDWYGGFRAYISESEYILGLAKQGAPLDIQDYGNDYYYEDEMYRSQAGALERLKSGIGIGLFIGLIAAFIRTSVLKAKMKNVAKASKADEYVTEHGVEIYMAQDRLSHIAEHRTRIESPSRSSGGHGGTSVSSSGFSGKSGKF